MSTFQATILAAGKGTRMKSNKIKILHDVCGRPIIEWVVRCALEAGASRVVPILGFQSESVEDFLSKKFGDSVAFAYQQEQLGTGHAIYSALDQLKGYEETTVVLSGDVPNLRPDTLSAFVSACEQSEGMGMMTAILEDAKQYGRIVRKGAFVDRIVEFKDASPSVKAINEINAGFYAFETEAMANALEELCSKEPTNAAGEYYLTTLPEMIGPFLAWVLEDHDEMAGVNTRVDLAEAMAIARRRINRFWMLEGVTFEDPSSTLIEGDVTLSSDVVVESGVQLRGETHIGSGTVIRAGSVVEDSTLGENVMVLPYCHLESAKVDDASQLGPFAHLRPLADIGKGCKVGNFVEVKKTRMDDGSKANHHAYLGDGHVGEKANIGAGTIFCNYDGKNKHKTEIGAGVFIGSNSSLVAPLKIGAGAYVGAGSTVTNDVPSESLAVARGKQRNIDGWARRKKEG